VSNKNMYRPELLQGSSNVDEVVHTNKRGER